MLKYFVANKNGSFWTWIQVGHVGDELGCKVVGRLLTGKLVWIARSTPHPLLQLHPTPSYSTDLNIHHLPKKTDPSIQLPLHFHLFCYLHMNIIVMFHPRVCPVYWVDMAILRPNFPIANHWWRWRCNSWVLQIDSCNLHLSPNYLTLPLLHFKPLQGQRCLLIGCQRWDG